MKNNLFISTLISACLSTSVIAADGTINFSGKVVDNACTVDPTLNLELGEILTSAFRNVGDNTFEQGKLFQLALKDCPAGQAVSVKFDGAINGKNPGFFMIDSGPDAATGVSMRIWSMGDNKNIMPGGSTKPLPVSADEALEFKAYYVSTDKVTAGNANASIQFSILYN
ncbi:fimbrial protein [Serratia nevei]|uniref:fimbrial protein n=1 Tax=Serratia nevei TaxID=2703794 RepID=UPI00209E1470|nr:fimbrial protein [Serratia nevei]MCP1107099.1 fimbrial protein [Serratia nevei]